MGNLLDEFSNTLNFSYVLQEAEDYGILQENNSWSGVVGHLARNEADVGLVDIVGTPSREKVMDFSKTFYFDTKHFVVAENNDLKRSAYTFFLSPYQSQVWWSVIFFAIFFVLLMYIYHYLIFRGAQCPRVGGLWDCVYAVIMLQGVMTSQRGAAVLVGMCFWLPSYTLLGIYYISYVKASTSVASFETTDTMEEVVKFIRSNQAKIHIPTKLSFLRDFIKGLPGEHLSIFKKVLIVGRDYTQKEMEKVDAGQLVSIVEGNMHCVFLQPYIERSLRFHIVKEPLVNLNFALGLNKNFTCKTEFNKIIVSLRESGCLDKWLNEVKTKSHYFRRSDEKLAAYVSFSDLQSSLVLLLFGYGLSLFHLLRNCIETYEMRK